MRIRYELLSSTSFSTIVYLENEIFHQNDRIEVLFDMNDSKGNFILLFSSSTVHNIFTYFD